jgi:hypothetical protein
MRNFSFFLLFMALLTMLAVSCGSSPPPADPVPAPAPPIAPPVVPPAEPPVAPPPEPEPVPIPEPEPELEPEPEPPVIEEEAPPAGPTAEERYTELLPRVDAARQKALDAGADETNPEGLSSAENTAAEGYASAQDGDYEAGITKLEEAIALFEKAAQDAVTEWEKQTAQAKRGADEQKAAADEVKAGNSAKTEYLAGSKSYENAQRATSAKDYRKAITEYEAAAGQFAQAAQIGAEKRDAAAAALRAAEKRVAESGEVAEEAAEEIERSLLDEGGNQ